MPAYSASNSSHNGMIRQDADRKTIPEKDSVANPMADWTVILLSEYHTVNQINKNNALFFWDSDKLLLDRGRTFLKALSFLSGDLGVRMT